MSPLHWTWTQWQPFFDWHSYWPAYIAIGIMLAQGLIILCIKTIYEWIINRRTQTKPVPISPEMKKDLYLKSVATGTIPKEKQLPPEKVDEYFGVEKTETEA